MKDSLLKGRSSLFRVFWLYVSFFCSVSGVEDAVALSLLFFCFEFSSLRVFLSVRFISLFFSCWLDRMVVVFVVFSFFLCFFYIIENKNK